MPTYEYRCTDCENDFSLTASMSEYDDGLDSTCPDCGSAHTERLLGSVLVSIGSSDSNGASEGSCCTPGSGCC